MLKNDKVENPAELPPSIIEKEISPKRRKIEYSTNVKYTILFLSSFVLLADYYAYDSPYSIKQEIKQNFFKNETQERYDYVFGILYTVYTIPNIILPFINGYLTDKVKNFCFRTYFA